MGLHAIALGEILAWYNALSHSPGAAMKINDIHSSRGKIGHCKKCGFADVLTPDGYCDMCGPDHTAGNPDPKPQAQADTHQWSGYEGSASEADYYEY
jgi:hypothetical protein